MSGRPSAPKRVTPAPLTDTELDRIPVTTREDQGGLTASAKANYRVRRRKAAGGNESYVGTVKLASEMGDVSEETARRTTRELVEKGYLEQTGRTRSGRPILLLGRGPAHTDDCATHTDDRDIEEGGKNPGFQPGGSSNQAAASPAPPTGGSAATERKRKTGWRFVWSGAGGSHIRDPEGTDPPPKRGSPEELDDLEHWSREAETRRREAELLQQDPEPLSIRQTIAENVREHIRGIDVERLKRLADGECDDCERPGECVPRWRLGKVAVCRDHVLRRQFARLRVAEIADGFRVPDERDVLAPVEPQSEIRWVAA